MNRRDLLKSATAGAIGLWASRRAFGEPIKRITDKIDVLDAGANLVSFDSGEGLVLVDSGQVAAYGGENVLVVRNVRILFNTHYHYYWIDPSKIVSSPPVSTNPSWASTATAGAEAVFSLLPSDIWVISRSRPSPGRT